MKQGKISKYRVWLYKKNIGIKYAYHMCDWYYCVTNNGYDLKEML